VRITTIVKARKLDAEGSSRESNAKKVKKQLQRSAKALTGRAPTERPLRPEEDRIAPPALPRRSGADRERPEDAARIGSLPRRRARGVKQSAIGPA